ncbi:hypothetical protein BJ912DRAFT_965549 [Pholiota molesta]|nr:hypothetical protein BJ912DRAFT_965549 [Pholiota molesta]
MPTFATLMLLALTAGTDAQGNSEHVGFTRLDMRMSHSSHQSADSEKAQDAQRAEPKSNMFIASQDPMSVLRISSILPQKSGQL